MGVDIFGLWDVIICKIRGFFVNSKRWVVLFICLVIWVVYIEVFVEMLLFLFINVLRWFIVIRGKVKLFRLDRGINFVGVIDFLRIDVICVEDILVK